MMPCYAGEQLIHINPEGKIRPCPFYETFFLGSVERDGVFLLGEDWEKEICRQIPHVCQYASGGVCDHCLTGMSLIYEFPRLLKWWLMK